MSDLTCPTCGGGPFQDRRGLGAHRVSHETATCDKCHQEVNRRGLGTHRKYCGLTTEQRAALAGPDTDAETTLEQFLATGIGTDAIRRCHATLHGAAIPDNGYLVIGATWGPHITSRAMVGHVVSNAYEPCVVIDLHTITTYLHRRPFREQAERERAKRPTAGAR